MNSDSDDPEGPGFPIRKSTDQSLFAAPHGLSQRTTSFIASCHQGIHRMPLGHLIALIINAHPERRRDWRRHTRAAIDRDQDQYHRDPPDGDAVGHRHERIHAYAMLPLSRGLR